MRLHASWVMLVCAFTVTACTTARPSFVAVSDGPVLMAPGTSLTANSPGRLLIVVPVEEAVSGTFCTGSELNGVSLDFHWVHGTGPGREAVVGVPAEKLDDPSVHTALREALEAAGCLTEAERRRIARQVRAARPARYDRMLATEFGYHTDRRTVDLRPGMELCVDYAGEGYNAVHDRYHVLGGSPACYPLGRDGSGRPLAFNAFFDRFALFERGEDPVAPKSGVRTVSSAADLSAGVGRAQRHWRLYYPAKLTASAPETSDDPMGNRPLLIGAATAGELDRLGRLDLVKYCANPNDPTIRVTCYAAAGRSLPYAAIPIRVNGERRLVPVGTTLVEVLESLDPGVAAALDDPEALARLTRNVRVTRRFDGADTPVTFQTRTAPALALPLAIGDTVSW